MSKKFTFDTQKAIQVAWDTLWERNLQEQKKDAAYAKKHGKKPYGWGRNYYLTALDLERMVRNFAEDTKNGEPWRKEPGYYGAAGIRFHGNLQSTVRHWLLRTMAGKIVGHNFGRGHISGMRFRPAGAPLAENEAETIVKHEEQRRNPKPKPRHWAKRYGSTALCVLETRKKQGHYSCKLSTCKCLRKMKGDFSAAAHKKIKEHCENAEWVKRDHWFGRGRSHAWTTSDRAEVTCPRCIKLLATLPAKETEAVKESEDA